MHKYKNVYYIGNVKIKFREKVHSRDPYYFCQFWGDGYYRVMTKFFVLLFVDFDQ